MDQKHIDQFEKLGIHFVDKSPFILDPRPGLLGVRVEIGVIHNTEIGLAFNILTVNKRGFQFTFSDFAVIHTPQGTKLTFLAYAQLPETTRPPFETTKQIATTFVDLCYFQGNEAVDPSYILPVSTQIAPNAVKEDLGWYLPSRFVDALIDGLGKVNDVFLNGLLEEAVVYGIVTKPDQSQLTQSSDPT